jgi:tetratricopeptide (TPR) repeat protein
MKIRAAIILAITLALITCAPLTVRAEAAETHIAVESGKRNSREMPIGVGSELNGNDQATVSRVMLLRNLDLYTRFDDYATAASIAKELLEWTEANLGSDDPEVSARLIDLGWLSAEQGRVAEAESHYKRALYAIEIVHGTNVAITTALSRLAGLYRSVERYPEAELLYHRLLSIQVRSGHETSAAATTLRDLAEVYRRQGNFDSAEPYYEYALKIFRHNVARDHPELGLTEASYNSMTREKQRMAQAEGVGGVVVASPSRE